MATLLFSALGTAVGGPFGGALGALVGRQVDTALFGSSSIKGPRLKELDVTTSSYGSILARHYGRMRVPGSIIWATELKEHSETKGGKNKPKVTTYTYSASFAVALASRPILGIGRIWADGKLLRGENGDLKVDGTMRIHSGYADQDPDPLMVQIEGPDRCPAYRGLAYVVFEDLDLSEFYNRLPALTFEVVGDDSFSLADMVGEVLDDTDADVPLDGIEGFTCTGPLAETLQQLDLVFPLDVDASGALLTVSRERLQAAPISLSEPAIAVDDGDFGGARGYTRRREPIQERPPEILRYYDTQRDYQLGLQRSGGRAGLGQPQTIELAAAMTASTARTLVEKAKQRADWSRDRLAWRTSELDMDVAPGSVVAVPGHTGRWRIMEWEWRDTGVELALSRIVPTGADQAPEGATDPGRINPPADLAAPPTSLVAFELPWEGTGNGDTPALYAAVSSSGSNWNGAALFVDLGTGELQSLGPSGRTRSIMGAATDVLPPANPLLADRQSSVTVALIDEEMSLANASARQLSLGWNKALLGNEIIQFASATPLGGPLWQLRGLLRGRGGTESTAANHAAGEHFVLLDTAPVILDPAIVAGSTSTTILAAGRGDQEPVQSPLALQGVTLRPLTPVHPRAHLASDGSLVLEWTRRARGAYAWQDGVETPVHEEAELYHVTYGPLSSPVATWSANQPALTLSSSLQSDLLAMLPAGEFHVQQQGSYALSEPLHITTLT